MSLGFVLTLLVPKKNGNIQMRVDSFAINLTIKYRYPIPRLSDMLNQLHGVKVFSRIDLIGGCHQIRMSEIDERHF